MKLISKLHRNTRWIFSLLGLCLLFFQIGCKPEGFINKVKYQEQKYINTCDIFTQEVQTLIKNNSNNKELTLSKYDNTEFNYFYLEQGQFEIKNDTLVFRLNKDLNYPRYLADGVSVLVNASYKAAERISELEEVKEGKLGQLIVDNAYYAAHRKPFFHYKIPLNGAKIQGKQLFLTFSIVQFDLKKGGIKTSFCNSVEVPLGTATPACCTANNWDVSNLQSIIPKVKVEASPESFTKYADFSGNLDVVFDENAYEFADSLLGVVLQKYILKYEAAGYAAIDVDIKGYASPNGPQELNQELSLKRAATVADGLRKANSKNPKLSIRVYGMGEDWGRARDFLPKSNLTVEQREEAQMIMDRIPDEETREKMLRKLPYWEQLKAEVFSKCRHTYTVIKFSYMGNNPTLEKNGPILPLHSEELEKASKAMYNAEPYKQGDNIEAGIRKVNEMMQITNKANLYAMRATFHLAKNDLPNTIADLEKAAELDPKQAKKYKEIVEGLKFGKIKTADYQELRNMYEEYNAKVQNDPNNKTAYFNRAILMDKIGYITGALGEYERLLGDNEYNAIHFNNRGVARVRTQEFTEAEADFLKASLEGTPQAESYYNLAIIYAYRGFTSRVIENLDKAIALDPSYKCQIFTNPVFGIISGDYRFEKYKQ